MIKNKGRSNGLDRQLRLARVDEVLHSGLGFQGSGFRVQGSGFRFQDSEFRV